MTSSKLLTSETHLLELPAFLALWELGAKENHPTEAAPGLAAACVTVKEVPMLTSRGSNGCKHSELSKWKYENFYSLLLTGMVSGRYHSNLQGSFEDMTS